MGSGYVSNGKISTTLFFYACLLSRAEIILVLCSRRFAAYQTVIKANIVIGLSKVVEGCITVSGGYDGLGVLPSCEIYDKEHSKPPTGTLSIFPELWTDFFLYLSQLGDVGWWQEADSWRQMTPMLVPKSGTASMVLDRAILPPFAQVSLHFAYVINYR